MVTPISPAMSVPRRSVWFRDVRREHADWAELACDWSDRWGRLHITETYIFDCAELRIEVDSW